jgi:ATP-dependent RNA circularization protein (DNA/RNA ligase family)
MSREMGEDIDPAFIVKLTDLLGFDKEKVRHIIEKNYLSRNWGKYAHLLRFDYRFSKDPKSYGIGPYN